MLKHKPQIIRLGAKRNCIDFTIKLCVFVCVSKRFALIENIKDIQI